MENLINWVELSRYLAGNESSVSRNRCPKKYKVKVDSLIATLKEWEEKNLKNFSKKSHSSLLRGCDELRIRV